MQVEDRSDGARARDGGAARSATRVRLASTCARSAARHIGRGCLGQGADMGEGRIGRPHVDYMGIGGRSEVEPGGMIDRARGKVM